MAECLNCGETPESLKRQGITMCAIERGYEYREIEHEFAHHRWADWRDRELDLMGMKPEAYEKHRRTPALHMQWVGCEDTKRGHVPAAKETDWEDFGCRIGQCIACGKVPESADPVHPPMPVGHIRACGCPECVAWLEAHEPAERCSMCRDGVSHSARCHHDEHEVCDRVAEGTDAPKSCACPCHSPGDPS